MCRLENNNISCSILQKNSYMTVIFIFHILIFHKKYLHKLYIINIYIIFIYTYYVLICFILFYAQFEKNIK